MKSLVCFAICCCWLAASMAQELPVPAGPSSFITRFPFKQYAGGIVIVTAKLPIAPDSLHFILDTGSGGISLDSATCVQNGIKTNPTDTLINGMGGIHKASYVFDQSICLPGLTIAHLNFHVNDYSLLSGVYGEKIDGIIGYSFFKHYIVKMDFDSLMLDVYAAGSMRYPKGGFVIRPTIGRIPVQRLTIGDNNILDYNFYFDTGAGLCFLISKAFAQDSNILMKRRKIVNMQAEGMGGRLPVQLSVMKFVRIGKYRFRKVPVYIYDDETNVTAYPNGGGLIGIDLLRRFNLVINYPAGEIHLLPNTHFDDPFDYAYTGLAIYYEQGIIYVDDVIPGSPGEKAGVKPGDILVGVNTNFSNDISQYKTLLQSSRQRILLSVRRKSELKVLPVYPGSIL